MRGRSRVALPALLLVSIVGLALVPAVSAHAEFVSSSPSPFEIWTVSATSIRVTLSEAVQASSARILVTNMSGGRVDQGATTLSATDPSTFSVGTPGLGPSVYTVTWSAISADDGHFSVGTFYFMVRNSDGTLPGAFPQGSGAVSAEFVSPLDVGLRALEFGGFCVAFGTLMFLLLLWEPARRNLEGPAAASALEANGALLAFARLGALVYVAAIGALWASNLIASPPATAAGVVGSTFLLSLALRETLGGALVVLLIWMLLAPTKPGGRGRPWAIYAGIGIGLAAILSGSFATHSAIVDAWWPVGPLADATHLYGVALWIGGLLAVVRVRGWIVRSPSPEFAELVLVGFSRFAFLAVALVIAAGIALAVILVGSLDALFGTEYGWVVLAKIGLLAPMVTLAALNRRNLRSTPTGPHPSRDVRTVTRRVRGEAALGAAVLVVAGLLTTVNPAALPPANPLFTQSGTSGGLYAIFQVLPFPAGPGDYTFILEAWLESNGSYDIGVTNNSASLTFIPPDGGTSVNVTMDGPHGPNHFFLGPIGILSRAGTWEIDARIVRTGEPLAFFVFSVTIRP